MTDDVWSYERLAKRQELMHLPRFIYGEYYAFLHWGDGTLNGHWCNTQTDEQMIEFFNYMRDQFSDIIKNRDDGYIDTDTVATALKMTNEAQQVYLKMNWKVG